MGGLTEGRSYSPNSFFPIAVSSLITKGRDNRPIAVVKVKDRKLHCLLDSGANNSIIGPEGLKLLLELGYETRRTERMHIYTAAKEEHAITGALRIPFEFRNKIKFIDFFYCPSVGHRFILGIDFWTAFEVRVQNKEGVWYCDSFERGRSQKGRPVLLSMSI